MESNFNHEQSLTLINEMIHRARNNFNVRGESFIFWGYLTAAIAVAQSILLNIQNLPVDSACVWFLMIPALVPGYFIERRSRRKTLAKTHIDRIAGMIWAGFFISVIVFSAVIHTVALKTGLWNVYLTNIPAMITMYGMGLFITAGVLRFKIWYAFAAFCWMGAIACIFSPFDVQFLIFALCMLVGMALPGHILNRKNHV